MKGRLISRQADGAPGRSTCSSAWQWPAAIGGLRGSSCGGVGRPLGHPALIGVTKLPCAPRNARRDGIPAARFPSGRRVGCHAVLADDVRQCATWSCILISVTWKCFFRKRVGRRFLRFHFGPRKRKRPGNAGKTLQKLVLPLHKTDFACCVFLPFWGEISCGGGAEPENHRTKKSSCRFRQCQDLALQGPPHGPKGLGWDICDPLLLRRWPGRTKTRGEGRGYRPQ
jgi:hypothetical protein